MIYFFQLLDRFLFGFFNKVYNKFCFDFFLKSVLNIINKWIFFLLFKLVWEDGVISENIVSGFCVCGIYLFNLYVIFNSVYLLSLVFDVL